MKPLFLVLIHCTCLIFTTGYAGDTLRYEVSLPNKVHHEAEIKLTIRWTSNQPLLIEMAQSSPGRYAVHNFAKNIYNLKVSDSSNNPLEIIRTKINQWKINAQGSITISYTLWGNTANGTFAGINDKQAMLNIPASFIYIPALKRNPISVKYNLPEKWQVATQMPAAGDRYFAPDLDYFMDSPTLLAAMDIIAWQDYDQNQTVNFRLAIHHQGDSAYLHDYVNWIKKIVSAQKNVFGEFPDFDYGSYTFIANYAPYALGDGMEHRNSTILSSSRSIFLAGTRLIGTVSHEFMHAWNVERLRPASLQPFFYDRANMSSALWFAEGFTSYYTDLILCRTGIIGREQYLSEVQSIVNTVTTSPGHNFHGPAAMSLMAPFTDDATHSDETCFFNTFISYYTYGAAIGLALDLSLRQFYQSSLDEYMKLLWQNFGKNEIPYTLADLENTLRMITDQNFARNFFQQHVYGNELPDFSSLLAGMGIKSESSFGNQLFLADYRPTINQYGIHVERYPEKNSPFYQAGLDYGDRIINLGMKKITNHDQIEKMLMELAAGDSLSIMYEQMGEIKTGYIKPAMRNHVTLTFADPSDKQKILLNDWLSDN